MAHRDNIQPSSFRGVPFEVESIQGTHGRRSVTHKYPKRDKSFSEDLGRETRRFTFEGFVVGHDYLIKKNNLINAIESSNGPGELIHPFFGRISVVVISFNVRESKSEGGSAHFSFVCEEAGDLVFPSSKDDTPSVVRMKASDALAATRSNFANSFSTLGQQDFINTEAEAVVDQGLTVINNAKGT